jgi:hypothetical protein
VNTSDIWLAHFSLVGDQHCSTAHLEAQRATVAAYTRHYHAYSAQKILNDCLLGLC